MLYRLKFAQTANHQLVKEKINLVDEDGNIVKTIDIDFDIDEKTKAFNKANNAIIAAEQVLKEDVSEAAQEQYGNAIIAILNVIFGEAGANEVLAFYENRYIEMSEELLPFIANVFIPEMRKRSEEKQKKLAEKYVNTR